MFRTCSTLTFVAAASIVLAGCGTGTDTPAVSTATTTSAASATTTITAPAATTASGATTSAAAAAPGSAARCSAATITPSLGTVPAPGGQITVPLYYSNSGSAPCTLAGYPGATLQGPDYPQFGPQYQLARATAVTPTTITLNPGQRAVADLTLGTVAATDATGWQPTALLTIAPGDTTVMTVPFPASTPVSRQDAATHPATYVGVFTGPLS